MKTTKLDNFSGMAVEIKYKDITEKYANECVERLRNIDWETHRLRKPYNEGWTVIEKPNGCIVWNETNWQLTWLLENGHLITNARGKPGRAAPFPHIRPTFESVKGAFIHDVQHAPLKTKFK